MKTIRNFTKLYLIITVLICLSSSVSLCSKINDNPYELPKIDYYNPEFIDNFYTIKDLSNLNKAYEQLALKYNVDKDYVLQVLDLVKIYSSKYDIEPNHIMALIGVESNFHPKAKSYLGEKYGRGLCQISSIVLVEYNRYHTEYTTSDMFDEEKNIEVACWYYNRLKEHYHIKDDLGSLMSAYNRGFKGGYAKSYVNKINANLEILNGGLSYEK